MPATNAFDYAVLRVVPSVERGEFVNVGVVMHCPALQFLGCLVAFDEEWMALLWPDEDLAVIRGAELFAEGRQSTKTTPERKCARGLWRHCIGGVGLRCITG